jgi:predicted transposase/invertase (TIGR01784 family)
VIDILNSVLLTEKESENIYIERVKLICTEANVVFTDKVGIIIIELPKFKKTEAELLTLEDKWLYSLKNMEKLPDRPKELEDAIFEELYENAKINKLTGKEMKAYKKSVLEYDDVILAVDYAEEKGMKRGMEKGMERGMEIGMEKGKMEGIEIGKEQERINIVRICYEQGLSIEQIIGVTGFSKERISAILSKS